MRPPKKLDPLVVAIKVVKKLSEKYAEKKAKEKIYDKYQEMLVEMFLNVVVLFLLTFVAPLFFEINTVKNLIVTYYIFTILRGLFSSIALIDCGLGNGLDFNGILDCMIKKEVGFFGHLFFGNTIKQAIFPTLISIIASLILYVVLFRFWALPYFVEDTTGMSLFELVFNSVWLPVSGFFSMIFHFVF